MTRVGISGHQSIPGEALGFVEGTIRRRLEELREHSEVEGITSLAAGADQLFGSLVLGLGGSLRVVVPSANYLSTFSDEVARSEYLRLCAKALSVEQLPFSEPTEPAFLAAGRRIVDLCDELIAVWDGLPAKGLGGTADIIEYAELLNRKITVAWPAGVQR